MWLIIDCNSVGTKPLIDGKMYYTDYKKIYISFIGFKGVIHKWI